MNKTVKTLLVLFATQIVAAALTFFAANLFGVYSFGESLVKGTFFRVAVGLTLAVVLLALVLLFAFKRREGLVRHALTAFLSAFVVSEVVSYLLLALIGVIAWKNVGNPAETSFASLIAFVAVSMALSLLITFIGVKLRSVDR